MGLRKGVIEVIYRIEVNRAHVIIAARHGSPGKQAAAGESFTYNVVPTLSIFLSNLERSWVAAV